MSQHYVKGVASKGIGNRPDFSPTSSALRHFGTSALRHFGTSALRHFGTSALRHFGTSALRHFGTSALRDHRALPGLSTVFRFPSKILNSLQRRCTMKHPLILIVAFLLPFPAFSQQNLTSKPVGFVRVELPAGAQTVVSIPFVPFSNSINAVFSGQLTGSTNANQADKIFKWDSANAEYVTAVKADGTGAPGVDGNWFTDTCFSHAILHDHRVGRRVLHLQ